MKLKERIAAIIGNDSELKIADHRFKLKWESVLEIEFNLKSVGQEHRTNILSDSTQRYMLIFKEFDRRSGLVYDNVADWLPYFMKTLENKGAKWADFLLNHEFIFVVDKQNKSVSLVCEPDADGGLKNLHVQFSEALERQINS